MSLSLPVPAFLSKSTRRNSSRSTSSSSVTLSEALRTNPFGTSRSKSQNPLLKDEDVETRRKALNKDLHTLARLFPDIKPEVLRELLTRFDGTSRLYVCVEQLLKYRAEWVKGRWMMPPRDCKESIPVDTTFRSDNYKDAVQTMLYLEFKALSKSTVDAVLAEGNSSYSYARPVLKDLSKKTWRATLGTLNVFRKKKAIDEPPSFVFQRGRDVEGTLRVKGTGSVELDEELAVLFEHPLSVKKLVEQDSRDRIFAETVNFSEAEEANAIYECDCCCSDTTFESMSACSTNGHIICFDCIRHTTHEALFGQGWGKSIDVARGTLKCLSPLIEETCEGCLSQDLVHRAIITTPSGNETWRKFEARLTSEALLKSQVKLVNCPFCSYAEADPLYQSAGHPVQIRWHFRPLRTFTPLLTLIILIEIVPFFLLFYILFSLLFPTLNPQTLFKRSLHNLSLGNRSPRFTCQSPTCSRVSCLRCFKPWHDPHVCHEPLLLSLRTTVEAARTAAIKRTCPRCGLSFVKASGCNKLTCVCGYAMCYLCRKSLTGGNTRAGGAGGALGKALVGAGGEQAQGEGYRHFCEHFRVNPGRPCDQCDKCDLYRAEDEDLVVRRAGEVAEKEWRIKEGMVGVEGFVDMNGGEGEMGGRLGWWKRVKNGEWDVQGFVDWGVGRVLVVET